MLLYSIIDIILMGRVAVVKSDGINALILALCFKDNVFITFQTVADYQRLI